MKLHDKIYGKGCETIILSQLMLLLGAHFIAIIDMPSAIETLQRVEEMQKRMTHCRDIDVIRRNLYMAASYSKLFQNDRALEYLDRALCLSHKIFGENNINYQLAEIYIYAASVYTNCSQHHDALLMLEQCLKLTKSFYGDTANANEIDCLNELGKHYLKTSQIDRAVESFKNALKQVKQVQPGQLDHAEILSNLEVAVYRAGNLDESLRYCQEAIEILRGHGEAGNLTLSVLNDMGLCYCERGNFLLAFQTFKDAVDVVDMTIISGNFYKALCENMAKTVVELSIESTKQPGIQSQIKKHQEAHGELPLTKDTCPVYVNNFYQMSWIGIKGIKLRREKLDKVLKVLEEARRVAKQFDYKCGRVVLVLLILSTTYGEMRSFEKSRSYYEEAKEMAKSLPPGKDDSVLPGELGMIEMMKK